jgi:hypothetical protein
MIYLRNVFLAIFLSFCLVGGAVAAQAPITRISDQDVIAWVSIPHFKQALAHVEAAAEAFAGEPVPIIAQIENHFNDPGLAALRDEPIVIMVMPSAVAAGTPVVVSFLPVNDGGALYQQMAQATGQKTAYLDQMLVLSQGQEGLDAAAKAMAAYREIAAAPVEKDCRIYVSLAKVMETWGPMMRMGAQTFTQMAAMAGQNQNQDPQLLGNILALEVAAFLALMDQSEDLQLDLSCDAESFTETIRFAAKTGSALAAVLTAPPAGPNPAQAFLGEPGAVACAGRFDADGLRTFVADLMDKSADKPETKALMDDAAKVINDFMTGFTGDFATGMRFPQDGSGGTNLAYSVTGKDMGVKYIDVMQAMLIDGALGKMYQKLGVNCAVKRSVRNHAGSDIHALTCDVTDSSMPKEQLAMMSAWCNLQVSATDQWLLVAATDAEMDTMIDRALTGGAAQAKPLKSQIEHGNQANFYLDYDIAVVINQMLAAIAPKDLPPATPSAPDPMTMAMTFANGDSSTDLRVPFKPLIAMADRWKEFNKIRQEQRRAQRRPEPEQAPHQEEEAPEDTDDEPEQVDTF